MKPEDYGIKDARTDEV